MVDVAKTFFEYIGAQGWFIQWCALWLLWGVYFICHTLVNMPFKMWNRYLRSRNIKHAGWPPPHLDADGDFKPEPEDG